MVFNFRKFQESDLSLFRSWLNQPHVKEFWQETEDDEKLKKKMLVDVPLRGVSSFIIENAEVPIGYIQSYDAIKVGGGWWENEPAGTFGIDLMIGSVQNLGKGFGSEIIKQFIAELKLKEPHMTSIIIDPEPKNIRAIKAYEKVGFVREGEIKTPNGDAILMRMLLLLVLCFLSPLSFGLVFEQDQRMDVSKVSDTKIHELAKSVFTFIQKDKLKYANGSFEFVQKTLLKDSLNLCKGEFFAEEPSVGTRCSGFLANSMLGVTAGHCVSPSTVKDFCQNYYIVFDYINKNGITPNSIPVGSVHECGRIKQIAYSPISSTEDDYAVIEFTKPVIDRKPLSVRKSGKIHDHASIFMLGYPRGMAQKISPDRSVVGNKEITYFETNLDCFRGNSGSPVFNANTYEVEGIFVRGSGLIPNIGTDPNLMGDFSFNINLNCNETLVCRKAEGCTAVMQANRITRLGL